MFINEDIEALYHNVEVTKDHINLPNDVFVIALEEALQIGCTISETYDYVSIK